MKIYWIDLFCGAGGVTTGIQSSKHNGKRIGKVIACVNHDELAIKSHRKNHPDCLHYTEDIRTLDLTELLALVNKLRTQEPECLIYLWGSLECTNFSNAKGGQSRDADSRTLAEHMNRYVEILKPDMVWIENVREFMSWGPLVPKIEKNKNGDYCPVKYNKKTGTYGPHWVPENKNRGKDYTRWVNSIKQLGYQYDYKLLNAADYGAHTSRIRLFIQFAKPHIPIIWPQATHSKKEANNLFTQRKPWKAVKEVLQLDSHGESIFVRQTPLCENTLKRVHAGLIKHVAGGKEAYMIKYNSFNQKNGKYYMTDLEVPCPVITTQNRLGVVQPTFLACYYGTGDNTHAIQNPAPTITTKDRCALVFLDKYFTSKHTSVSPNSPAGSITTIDHHAAVHAQFLNMDYSTGGTNSSIETPAGSITGVPKHNLVTTKPYILDMQYNNATQTIENPLGTITAIRHYHYIVNPSWANSCTGSMDEPGYTIIARQDKSPLSLVSAATGNACIVVYPTDSETMVQIKEFMAMYGIVDIYMRMLYISELKRIQGFPEKYILEGSSTHQKKFIGNSVPPAMVRALVEANYTELTKTPRTNKLAA